jgi:hypothetical protein
MPQPRRTVTFRVRFHPARFSEDIDRARPAGRAIAVQAREQLEQHGVSSGLLASCEAEHRDGTDLPGCAKLYLPMPYGEWGLVLQGAHDTNGAYLLVVAFGERHPAKPPNVYQIAHRRLHG